MTPAGRRAGVLCLAALVARPVLAFAQQPPPVPTQATTQPERVWSFRASAATYVLPDDDNYVQPAVAADRGSLHLEARYNYEDRRSGSLFAGWNFTMGHTVTLELTPMLGGLAGRTDGVVPALEATLTFRRFEYYAETEYVIDLNESSDSFLYGWSEFSLYPVERLRVGVVLQRTRVFRTPRDVQRGLLAGIAIGRLEGAVYFFNPGSSDHYYVISAGVSF